MKLFKLASAITALMLVVPAAAAPKKIVLGFSQIGAESEWRTANTESIKAAAKEAGIELKFSDAQQKEENQLKAIRGFIAQKVDVIAFSPVVESGWETVLKEAKAAKIPVILSDRAVDVKDQSLWVSFMGSDFVEEGRRAGNWLVGDLAKKGMTGDIDIVELQGTVGSAPAIDRKKGFEEILKSHPNLKITRSQTGDFTRTKGKEVMEAFLKADPNIQVLFAHNDDMAIGAIQAIEEARLHRRREGCLRGHDGRQAQLLRGMQPPPRPPAHVRRQGPGRRQDPAQAHRHPGRRLPRREGRRSLPQPQVLVVKATPEASRIPFRGAF